MQSFKNIFTFLSSHQTLCICILLTFLSITSFAYYYATGLILLFGDANSRLNIARGVIDSLRPGLGQLSNVWLPLPTLLMLPFIWNNFLWHSGIAGSVVSMAAYIIGGVYLFKSAKIISQSFFASFGATLIYALNINLLYFQTTAMSEPIFITALILGIYNLLVWIQDSKKLMYLIFAGIAMTAASLIRYEGWAVMFVSIPAVAFYLWLKTKNYKVMEGNTILYTTIAVFGFVIWSLYLTTLYGDPLYWQHVYLSPSFQSTSKSVSANYTFNLSVIQASIKYLTAIVWMNGVIPALIALFSLPVLIVQTIRKKTFYFLPLLLQSAIFLFMVYTLQRNTPINQPELTVAHMLSAQTQAYSEFNMRYGLTLLPLVALLSTYLFSIRFIVLRLLLVALLTIQVYSYFVPFYTVIYQIPLGNNIERVKSDPIKGNAMVQWLKGHYDGGLIMISAKIHNPEMLELGFNFKTYIHEGTGEYWKKSIIEPQTYATWIVSEPSNKDDQVAKYLNNSQVIKNNYTLVFNENGIEVYKIKTRPLITTQ